MKTKFEDARGKAAASGEKAFGNHTVLDHYLKLFDLVSGGGTLPDSEDCAFYEKKGLMGDYGMILANIVLKAEKIPDRS